MTKGPARMSGLRGADGPYRTVRMGCTGRGVHRVEKFGTVRVWPDGTIDPRFSKAVDTSGWPMLGVELSCSQCPRSPRLHESTLRTIVIDAAAAGEDRLDISTALLF